MSEDDVFFSRLAQYGVDPLRVRTYYMRNTGSIGLKFRGCYAKGSEREFILISGVSEGSECERAGVQEGILKSIAGVRPRTCGEAMGAISKCKQDTIVLEAILFETIPVEHRLVLPVDSQDSLGADFKAVSQGVMVHDVEKGSLADKAGLTNSKNKFILKVNNRTINCRSDLETEVLTSKKSGRGSITMLIEGNPNIPRFFRKPSTSDPSIRQFPMTSVRDAEGYIWLDVEGEESALTLQPHHLATRDGVPIQRLPYEGDVVMITGLPTQSEMYFNGLLGTVIAPGDVHEPMALSENSICSSSVRSVAEQHQQPVPLKQGTVQPQVMGDVSVFRSMLKSPNAKQQIRPTMGTTDWQTWIRVQQQRGLR
eukprot:TRINITY_DN4638_c0_g1_i1.p1 TRINITY_DN4638_c0_g1~~TRINITY_DN4638_c0_g1_i1.p1  ORF type:complete len:368 (+),score=42.95 TRINITY_DN4638_c0_g1_i1:31-1134(+)